MDKIRLALAKPAALPFFTPWRGSDYQHAQAASLSGEDSCCDGLWHLMGESHYGSADEQLADFTSSVIDNLALGGYRFFNTLLSIVAGKSPAEVRPDTDWQRFAFSNFVQRVLPVDDRRPSASDWAQGRASFFGQLAITRPKQLLVVGKSQWRELPTEGYTPIEIDSPFGDGTIPGLGIYGYEVDGEAAFTIATWIYHPSSRGKLDMEEARKRVSAVTMVSCNILSAIGRDATGWYIEGAA